MYFGLSPIYLHYTISFKVCEEMFILFLDKVGNRHTVKSGNKDHLKLRRPSLLSLLISVPKCIYQCKWVSLMRPVNN